MAGLIGNSHLWGRRQSLSAPLRELERWSPRRLQEEALQRLDPAQAYVLQAVPA